MPISGEIVELNEAIEDEPEVVNDDAYGKGWMIKIKVSEESDFESLLSAEEYKSLIS